MGKASSNEKLSQPIKSNQIARWIFDGQWNKVKNYKIFTFAGARDVTGHFFMSAEE
jgi:hypothetical protein